MPKDIAEIKLGGTIGNNNHYKVVEYTSEIEYDELKNGEEVTFIIPDVNFPLNLKQMSVTLNEKTIIEKSESDSDFYIGQGMYKCINEINNLYG
jgi:hypothetical protein